MYFVCYTVLSPQSVHLDVFALVYVCLLQEYLIIYSGRD